MHLSHPIPSKHVPRAARLGAALLLLAVSHARGESWQVILPTADFAPLGLGNSVILDPYSSAPAPGVLLAGTRSAGASLQSVARITPLDAAGSEFAAQSLDGLNTGARQVLHNPGDGLYVFGHAASGGWYVRRSDEAHQGQPGTWQDEDAFRFSWVTGTGKKQTVTQGGGRSMGAAVDGNGGVWAAGYASDAEAIHWIVRHKPLGETWQPRLDLPGATAASRRESRPVTSVSGICYFPGNPQNPTPALLAYGILNSRWTVVRSENGFAHYEVQSWSPDGSTAAEVWGGTIDAQGRIYLCGVHGYEGQQRGWIVRGSDDGGRTWTTLLNKREADNSFAARIMVDTTGTVWVAGGTMSSPSPRTTWTVVRNHPGQPWQDSADGSDSWSQRVYPLGANSWSRGRGMVDDGQGTVYLTGDVLNPTATSLEVLVGLLRWDRSNP